MSSGMVAVAELVLVLVVAVGMYVCNREAACASGARNGRC